MNKKVIDILGVFSCSSVVFALVNNYSYYLAPDPVFKLSILLFSTWQIILFWKNRQEDKSAPLKVGLVVLGCYYFWPDAGGPDSSVSHNQIFLALFFTFVWSRVFLEIFKKRKDNKILFVAGNLGVFCGLLLKIMHWPMGIQLLLTGFFILLLWTFIPFFRTIKIE